MDPLRDEAIIFERRLRENGTKTKVDIYPGVPHNFWSVFPTINLSKKFVQDTVKGVEWLLDPVKT
jgi:acetyl esterase/lipase